MHNGPVLRAVHLGISLIWSFFCQIEFGIVYSCMEDKMYTARKGKGAFCNGIPVKVSEQQGEFVDTGDIMITV